MLKGRHCGRGTAQSRETSVASAPPYHAFLGRNKFFTGFPVDIGDANLLGLFAGLDSVPGARTPGGR